MQFSEVVSKMKEIKQKYQETPTGSLWKAAEYTQGLVGDVGDLTKLIMAKNGLRTMDDVDQKLSHELSDCLWAVLAIADELEIDLEKEFVKNMDELKQRIA